MKKEELKGKQYLEELLKYGTEIGEKQLNLLIGGRMKFFLPIRRK